MKNVLDENDIKKIELLIEKGLNNTEISEIVGISTHTVGKIRRGEHCSQKPQEKNPGTKGAVNTDLTAAIQLLAEAIERLNVRLSVKGMIEDNVE